MLGDMTCETTGKRVVRRVLSVDPLTVEVSFEDTGKVLGIDITGFGTYTAAVRPDGSIFGDGQGAYITQDGELASNMESLGRWRIQGKGCRQLSRIPIFSNGLCEIGSIECCPWRV
jgi:hypothetical protein